jgi:two-component system sensor histidine kinase DesK
MMWLVLVTSPGPILSSGVLRVAGGVAIRVKSPEGSGRVARLAIPAALVYGSVFPLVQLGVAVTYPDGSREVSWPLAVTATAAYLPLHLRHVSWAARGERPPAGGWTLAALAVVVTAALPFVGSHWLPVFAVVAADAMFVLAWPRSLLVAGGVVAAQVPLALAVDSPLPDAASHYVFSVWWWTASLFAPIWLLGAIGQLQEARQSLAEEAVVRERLRIDGEIRRTVSAALDSIATRGQRATMLVVDDDLEVAASEVRELVEGSRRSLVEVRRVINGYQQPPLDAELETAAALLTAAGITTRVEMPDHPLPSVPDPTVRSELRAATAEILRDSSAQACVITVSSENGQLRVTVRTEAEARAGAPGHGADAGGGGQARAS